MCQSASVAPLAADPVVNVVPTDLGRSSRGRVGQDGVRHWSVTPAARVFQQAVEVTGGLSVGGWSSLCRWGRYLPAPGRGARWWRGRLGVSGRLTCWWGPRRPKEGQGCWDGGVIAQGHRGYNILKFSAEFLCLLRQAVNGEDGDGTSGPDFVTVL